MCKPNPMINRLSVFDQKKMKRFESDFILTKYMIKIYGYKIKLP